MNGYKVVSDNRQSKLKIIQIEGSFDIYNLPEMRKTVSKVVARFRGGEPAVLEKKLGSGRILWVTTACDLDWGDWPRSRLYVPMVHQMLGYLGHLAEGGPVRGVPLEKAAEGPQAVPGVFQR
jgi:hypothetical protein